MKYIEPIKSLILTFLVLMSLVLTFMIWSYKPDYPFTEDPKVDGILMGDRKNMSSIIKPYRMLFSTEDGFSGTATAIDPIIEYFNQLKPKSFTFVNGNLSAEKVNEMIRVPNRMTMFFQSDIPLQTFQRVISVEETEFDEAVFNRLIMDWNTVNETQQAQIFFVSTNNETVYRMDIEIEDIDEFNELFIVQPKSYVEEYVEKLRENNLSLYLVNTPLDEIQYTYYTFELRSELLKNLLFEDTSIVEKTVEESEEVYTDSMSILTLNTQAKTMDYVDWGVESIAAISPYNLLLYTFDFINGHGGFTEDYRLASMNLQKHIVEYQLYLQGYPVFSSTTSTRISTTWGENRIHRYRRPYYLLDFNIDNEITGKQLDSGVDIVQYIERHTELDLSKIDDIVVGYDLIQNPDSRLFRLEPSWFAITGNTSKRIPTEWIRGDEYGLE